MLLVFKVVENLQCILKEEHQGLLKLHVHLVGFQFGEKWGKKSPKREFCLKRKKPCEEAFQDLLKSNEDSNEGSNEGFNEGSNEEKMGRQQKEELL